MNVLKCLQFWSPNAINIKLRYSYCHDGVKSHHSEGEDEVNPIFSNKVSRLRFHTYIKWPVHTSDFPAIFSFWRMWTSKPVTNVEVRKHALSTFVVNPLVHICQKEKIAAKNRDLIVFTLLHNHDLYRHRRTRKTKPDPSSSCPRHTSRHLHDKDDGHLYRAKRSGWDGFVIRHWRHEVVWGHLTRSGIRPWIDQRKSSRISPSTRLWGSSLEKVTKNKSVITTCDFWCDFLLLMDVNE